MIFAVDQLYDHVAVLNRHNWVIASNDPYVVVTPRDQKSKIVRQSELSKPK